MRNLRWHRSRTSRLLLLSAAACVASGGALAQVPITKVITVQPIDVCVQKAGPHGTTTESCAPFNTNPGNPSPTTQNSTTNPIGFVYSYTNSTTNKTVYIDITRAMLNQIGIDINWNPMVQYNSPVINTTTGQTYQTLNVVQPPNNCGFAGAPATGFQSCDFLNLSQQPCISKTPNPVCKITSPLSTTPSVINMFFVNTLNPPPSQAGGQLYGFSWTNDNGVSIGANTFFPPAPLTPFVSVLAHELMHNLGVDHVSFGAGPCNPITVDADGGALQGTSCSPTPTPPVTAGECDSGYPECMANLMTIGSLRTEPTVNCVAVSNPPQPGETACAAGTPTLANGMADQLTLINQEWTPGLPQSQQGAVLDPSGFLQPIPNSTTTVSASGSSMTVTVTGATGGASGDTLLAWVLWGLPSGLKYNSQFHIISESRKNLVMDADFPQADKDNNVGGAYYIGSSLYTLCTGSSAQCLIVEFNLPGAGATDQIKFTKGFTTQLTTAELCGAQITSIFGHGYSTTSQLACPGGVVPPGGLMASSWSPDLTAPVPNQTVNQTAAAAAAAGSPPCTLVDGVCPDPTAMGVFDANVLEEPQPQPLCLNGGVLGPCP
jgi:hypothetical protein